MNTKAVWTKKIKTSKTGKLKHKYFASYYQNIKLKTETQIFCKQILKYKT